MLLLLSPAAEEEGSDCVTQTEWMTPREREREVKTVSGCLMLHYEAVWKRERARERGAYKEEWSSSYSYSWTQGCYWDVRETVINQPGYIYPLHLVFYVRAHLFGLPEVYGPLVVCFTLVVVFIKVRGPHGRWWWPQGANQELQSLLLQQLQSGKKTEREESVLEFVSS